jgi:WW domain-containing oxidoreductase
VDPRIKPTVAAEGSSADAEAGSLVKDVSQGVTADGIAARVKLGNRVAIVTGATSGIGLETARVLASRGAAVVLGCRTIESGKQAVAAIKAQHTRAKVTPLLLELTSNASIRTFVTAVEKLHSHVHILVCNAGSFGLPFAEVGDKSDAPVETTFAANHLGHFVLCNLLVGTLQSGARHHGAHARVVVVADESHRRNGGQLKPQTSSPCTSASNYWAWDVYSQSKLCNIIFAIEFNKRFSGTGIMATSLHPGTFVHTNIGRNWWVFRMASLVASAAAKTVNQAAACTVYCAVAPELEGYGGRYFVNCQEELPSEGALDPKAGAALWTQSIELSGLPQAAEQGSKAEWASEVAAL